MKRNSMCPICYIKQFFARPQKISNIYSDKPYANGVALTPPMGWSSWNTFRNKIDQNLIYDTAVAMKDKGLIDAGYKFINLDDNWHSSLRDEDGNLQGDLTTFSEGIPALIKKINALGLKVGVYSSNGTNTCEDLPASLYREHQDALTIAEWGVEYFKYDFCHNVPLSKYAPLPYGITIAKVGESEGKFYTCVDAKLSGLARFMFDDELPTGKYISGLDRNVGAAEFTVNVENGGDYILTVDIVKRGKYEKYLMALINDKTPYVISVPPQKVFNKTARFQVKVSLVEGDNTVKLFNPIHTRADSAMLQYQYMGKMLIEAAEKVAAKNDAPVKPITYSICEWGWNQPYKWGMTAGNLWRTTPDIRPIWPWIKIIYNHTVKLYKYAGIGGWNDPDMLEVGNGKLSYDENISHFTLWCMMCAPLILGNDLREMPQNVLDIVTNKNLISINQDTLGKPAKRIIKGIVDVLVKPLADGSVAVCLFNKSKMTKKYNLNVDKIIGDEYSALKKSTEYEVTDLWNNTSSKITDMLSAEINGHGVRIFRIK